MMQRLSRLRRDEGFTLIELLIVIIILGILAAIVVFSVSGITNRGTSAACSSDVTTVTTAAEAYFAQNSSYPAAGTSAADMTALTPTFLHSVPTDVVYTEGATNQDAPTVKGNLSTTSTNGC